MAKFKIEKSNTVNQYFDATNVIGGTGGLFSVLTPTVVSPNVYVQYGTVGAAGSIIRQKGRHKFLVADSTSIQDENIRAGNGNAYIITSPGNTNWAALGGPAYAATAGEVFTPTTSIPTLTTNGVVNLLGVCLFQNVPAANLSVNNMSLPFNTSSFTANIGNLGVSGATTYASVIWSNANVAGVTKPTIGSYLTGLTGITGNVTITSIAAYGTNGSNANVAINSQTVANVASATVSTTLFARRLQNKFVFDFNLNKYQWTFNAPTATTVQVQGA